MAEDRVYGKVACIQFNSKSKYLLIPDKIGRNWLIRQLINQLNLFGINLLTLRTKKIKKGSQNLGELDPIWKQKQIDPNRKRSKEDLDQVPIGT